MKIFILMILTFTAMNAFSQATVQLPQNTSFSNFGTNTWELIKSKTKVRYFSETMGPSITKGGDRQIDWDKNKKYVKGQDPISTFNQVSVQWQLNSNWEYVVQPRFTYRFGDTEGYSSNQDKGPFQMEDTRTAIQGVWLSNTSGSATMFLRAGVRLPTAKNDRNANMLIEPDISNFFDWAINKRFAVFVWSTFRSYVYHSSSTQERWRLYNAPGFTYSFNDRWGFQAFYENEIVHNIPKAGQKKWNYAASNYEDIYMGPQYVASPSLTLFPFIRPSQLKKPSLETTAVGLWVVAKMFH